MHRLKRNYNLGLEDVSLKFFKDIHKQILDDRKIPEDVFLPKRNVGCHLLYGLNSEGEGFLEPDLSNTEEKEFSENEIEWEPS